MKGPIQTGFLAINTCGSCVTLCWQGQHSQGNLRVLWPVLAQGIQVFQLLPWKEALITEVKLSLASKMPCPSPDRGKGGKVIFDGCRGINWYLMAAGCQTPLQGQRFLWCWSRADLLLRWGAWSVSCVCRFFLKNPQNTVLIPWLAWVLLLLFLLLTSGSRAVFVLTETKSNSCT